MNLCLPVYSPSLWYLLNSRSHSNAGKKLPGQAGALFSSGSSARKFVVVPPATAALSLFLTILSSRRWCRAIFYRVWSEVRRRF